MGYETTLSRVEDYFDRTATQKWEALTSDAPVSGIRATVREGRAQMAEMLLGALPNDLTGARVLDAGCGTGTLAIELAERGADVVAIDIAPNLIEIAKSRHNHPRIDWRAGEMLDPGLGSFDYGVAMDSMIYYSANDVAERLGQLAPRLRNAFVFTLPPRTPMLMAMWRVGKLFPKSDRSPTMVPTAPSQMTRALAKAGVDATLSDLGRIHKGFYISNAYRFEAHP